MEVRRETHATISQLFLAQNSQQTCGICCASALQRKEAVNMKTAEAAHLSLTTLPVNDHVQAMFFVAKFFEALGTAATFAGRKQFSLKVRVSSDGVSSLIKVKCWWVAEAGCVMLEWLRFSGDSVLFNKLWRMYNDSLATNTMPSSEALQLTPGLPAGWTPPAAPILRPSPMPMGAPSFYLDVRGEKRKLE